MRQINERATVKQETENIEDINNHTKTRLECFRIQEIVACKLEKGMPEILRYNIGESRDDIDRH